MKTRLEAIGEAIGTLNSNYGRGDVTNVNLQTGKFAFEIHTSHYVRSGKMRTFNVIRETENSVTVSACGHTLTVQLDPLKAQADKFRMEFYRLLVALKKDIADDFRATDDSEDDRPGMCVTLSTNDGMSSWSYQTGDNSFTGGCYSQPHWAVIYLYRNSNSRELADDAVNQLLELVPDHTLASS